MIDDEKGVSYGIIVTSKYYKLEIKNIIFVRHKGESIKIYGIDFTGM